MDTIHSDLVTRISSLFLGNHYLFASRYLPLTLGSANAENSDAVVNSQFLSALDGLQHNLTIL